MKIKACAGGKKGGCRLKEIKIPKDVQRGRIKKAA